MAENLDFISQEVGRISARTSEGKNFSEPGADFYKKYEDEFIFGILQAAHFINPKTPTTTIEIEGKAGILPAPAKRIIVREALAGQPLSPLKVSEEEIIRGKPERVVELATVHVIADVNPTSAANPREIETMLNTLLSVRKSTDEDNMSYWYIDKDEPLVRVLKFQAQVHMLRRGVVGNYDSLSLPLNNPDDLRKAIEQYRKSLAGVLSFDPSKRPSEDQIPHIVFNRSIADKISIDEKYPKIHLPVVVAPKDYRTGIGGYSYHHTSVLGGIPSGMSLIIVNPGGNVDLAKQG